MSIKDLCKHLNSVTIWPSICEKNASYLENLPNLSVSLKDHNPRDWDADALKTLISPFFGDWVEGEKKARPMSLSGSLQPVHQEVWNHIQCKTLNKYMKESRHGGKKVEESWSQSNQVYPNGQWWTGHLWTKQRLRKDWQWPFDKTHRLFRRNTSMTALIKENTILCCRDPKMECYVDFQSYQW